MRMSVPADVPRKQSFEGRFFDWRPTTTLSWMVARFLLRLRWQLPSS
jgi:hypothetical protein